MNKNISIQIDETEEGILFAVLTDTGKMVQLLGAGMDDTITPVLSAINTIVERAFNDHSNL